MKLKRLFVGISFTLLITMINIHVNAAVLPSITSDKSFHEIIIGPVSSFKYDLDGDGKLENVGLKKNNDGSYNLSVSNKAIIKVDVDCGIRGVSVVDLNKYDKYKQIAIFQSRSNDYNCVELYSFKNNKIKRIGQINAVGYKLYINNKSELSGVTVNQFFQTDEARLYYRYNSNDTLTEIKFPYYALKQYSITAKVSVRLRKNSSTSSSVITTINPGEKVKVIGTDRRNWVLLQTSRGVRGWLQTDGNRITELNKEEYDVFSGIVRAG